MARGPAAQELAELWWILLALGGAVYALVMALLLAAVVRRRGAADEPDERDDGVRCPPPPARTVNRWIGLGGVALPAVVLPVALGVSVATMRDLPDTAPADLVVEVTGHQWWWSVRYPASGVTVANEIRIPTGRPVQLRLRSTDVIHSFWVPALAGKVDALPDRANTLVLEADEPGEYEGACAEFCGLQHAKHRLLVVAEAPARFAAWLEERRRPAAVPPPEGERVFAQNGCGRCHTVRGTAFAGRSGPDLTHFAGRRTLTAAHVPHTRGNLARWLRNPASVKEGTRMPAADLSAADLDALLAYLAGLR